LDIAWRKPFWMCWILLAMALTLHRREHAKELR
jgi:hypothetical protein